MTNRAWPGEGKCPYWTELACSLGGIGCSLQNSVWKLWKLSVVLLLILCTILHTVFNAELRNSNFLAAQCVWEFTEPSLFWLINVICCLLFHQKTKHDVPECWLTGMSRQQCANHPQIKQILRTKYLNFREVPFFPLLCCMLNFAALCQFWTKFCKRVQIHRNFQALT